MLPLGSFRTFIFLSTSVVLCQILSSKADIIPLNINPLPVSLPKPAVPQRGVASAPTQSRDGFVSTKDGKFYLDNQLFNFRGFNGPTLLDGTIYENTDLLKSIAGFGTPVTRIYTLKVANEAFGLTLKPQDAHITGWDNSTQDWIYNEEKWKQMDIALAAAADHGVKLIMPLINQDYGKSDSDWVGNFLDLIRHRFGISDYTTAQTSVDWFVDPRIRIEFKKIIKKFLTRVNTVNGRVYGHDDTFLAFETGNEMNWANITTLSNGTVKLGHVRPAPAEWTIDIAQYIKALAPNTLVMDGSFSRDPTNPWPEETLKSPYVDIFSYHLYGDGDILLFNALNDRVNSYGKTFVIGEHGFYNSESAFQKAYDTFTCAGALVWSLRPHSETSGFQTHSESSSVFSYHVPGWTNSTASNFDPREADVVHLTYRASFHIADKPVAPYPVPGAPFPFFATNGTHTGISWKGAAWAQNYEIWASSSSGEGFVKVVGSIHDNVEAGKLFIPINPKTPTSPLEIPYAPIVQFPFPMPVWHDTKWASTAQPIRGIVQAISTPVKRDIIQSLPSKLQRRRRVPRDSSAKGGWYIVRGISVDGIPGVFSEPTFISSSYN